jgi:hypothetical protein
VDCKLNTPIFQNKELQNHHEHAQQYPTPWSLRQASVQTKTKPAVAVLLPEVLMLQHQRCCCCVFSQHHSMHFDPGTAAFIASRALSQMSWRFFAAVSTQAAETSRNITNTAHPHLCSCKCKQYPCMMLQRSLKCM